MSHSPPPADAPVPEGELAGERLIEFNFLWRRYAGRLPDGTPATRCRVLSPVRVNDQGLPIADDGPAVAAVKRVQPFVDLGRGGPSGAAALGSTIELAASKHAVDVIEVSPSGVPLDGLVGQHGALPWRVVHAIASGAAERIQHIHDAGLMHLAIRPELIVVSGGGRVGIRDVAVASLARALEPAFRFPNAKWEHVHPQPESTAPELLGPDAPTTSVDVFSLAVSLYFAAYGALPYSGQRAMDVYHAQRRSEVRSVSSAAQAPARREAWMSALSPHPDERPSSAPELVELLFGSVMSKDERNQELEPIRRSLHDEPWYDGMRTLMEPGGPAAENTQQDLLVASQTLHAARMMRPARKETKRSTWWSIGFLLAAAAASMWLALRAKGG